MKIEEHIYTYTYTYTYRETEIEIEEEGNQGRKSYEEKKKG